MKIKNIEFKNIPDKRLGTKITTRITQSNVGDLTNEEYLSSNNYYKIFNSIDIDWNGIEIDENTEINDTADLILIIKSLLNTVKELSNKVDELEEIITASDLQINYESEDGNIQIINPDEPDLQIEYESEDGDIQILNE